MPAEMALRAEKIGVSKANMSVFTLFALGVLAGIFIALGAIFSTTVTAPTMGLDPATGDSLAKYLPFGHQQTPWRCNLLPGVNPGRCRRG